MASSPAPKSSVLNSWKEIASYLGRGVRTVQRWEHDLAMPVRRPRAKSRSAVVALPEELDAWLRRAPSGELLGEVKADRRPNGAAEAARDLRLQCAALRAQNRVVLAQLLENLQRMESTLKEGHGYRDELMRTRLTGGRVAS